jgi:hypothetical protein
MTGTAPTWSFRVARTCAAREPPVARAAVAP